MASQQFLEIAVKQCVDSQQPQVATGRHRGGGKLQSQSPSAYHMLEETGAEATLEAAKVSYGAPGGLPTGARGCHRGANRFASQLLNIMIVLLKYYYFIGTVYKWFHSSLL